MKLTCKVGTYYLFLCNLYLLPDFFYLFLLYFGYFCVQVGGFNSGPPAYNSQVILFFLSKIISNILLCLFDKRNTYVFLKNLLHLSFVPCMENWFSVVLFSNWMLFANNRYYVLYVCRVFICMEFCVGILANFIRLKKNC